MDNNTIFGGCQNMSRCQQMDLEEAIKEVRQGHLRREESRRIAQDARDIKDAFSHLSDVSLSKLMWAVATFGRVKVIKAAQNNLSKFTFGRALTALVKKKTPPVKMVLNKI